MPDAEITLKGQVEEIIFENEANGYKVLAVSGDEDFIAVGKLPAISLGELIEFSGEWVEHPSYGRQLNVQTFRPILPDSEDAIYHYLCSGLIKGIGPRTAARLISLYGPKTLEVLRDEPAKVAKIKGVGLRKAQRIAAQIAEKLEYQDLVLMLTPHGIGTGLVFRIFREWGAGAAARIRENPYDLADEIDGIGFLTADKIARALGLSAADPARLASGLQFQLSQAVYAGHTYLPRLNLLTATAELVSQPVHLLEPVLDEMTADTRLIAFDVPKDGAGIALPIYYQIEKSAARRLNVLLDIPPTRYIDWQDEPTAKRILSESGQALDLELAPEQEQALIMALAQSFCVLTGGPGTGKTTIIRVLTDSFKRHGGRVLLAAPTGRAARRLSELTGCPAQTLHRLLALPFAGQTQNDPALNWLTLQSETPLNCDLLVVDEVSMLDIVLFRSLLEAIVPGTRVLLVGDADQLPAIGPGQVLANLLESGALPTVRLTKIFRQSHESLIVRNAHHILNGDRLETDQSFDSTFIFVAKEDAEAMGLAAIRLASQILPQQYGFDPHRDIQVLTPSHKGPAGTVALNHALQGKVLEAQALMAHGVWFQTGDKVMQMRNQYELEWTVDPDLNLPNERSGSTTTLENAASQGKGVFNGEVGLITAIDDDDDELTVLFDDGRRVIYDRAALEDLDLAYAVTVHKSQGSEYPVVVLVIPPTAPRLLTRNLLYTAVTRARQKLLLVTSKRILHAMLGNWQKTDRFTLLDEWLSATTAKP
ncbi:MAG: AAA family ATPase [Eubacteriales bacterium]|nr:AAA family ATPase [Eubacteriales bacterium]